MNTYHRRIRRAGTYLLILLAVVVLAFPLYWMTVTAFTSRSALLDNVRVLPEPANMTVDNFKKIIESHPILTWFGNSVFVTAFSTVSALIVSTMAAYSMSRYKYRSTNFLGFFLLVVRMLPETLLVVPLYMMFTNMKLINNYASLIISNITFIIPFSTWMMKGYFDSIPTTLEEAARIDGAGEGAIFFRIGLPLGKAGIISALVLQFLECWNMLEQPMAFLKTPSLWPLSMFQPQITSETAGAAFAASVFALLPAIWVFLAGYDFLEQGIQAYYGNCPHEKAAQDG